MRRARVVILAGTMAAASAGCTSVTGPGDADLFLEVVETRVGGPNGPAFVVDFRGVPGEGAVVGALCSPSNRFTQYWIETNTGDRFWATSEEIHLL